MVVGAGWVRGDGLGADDEILGLVAGDFFGYCVFVVGVCFCFYKGNFVRGIFVRGIFVRGFFVKGIFVWIF